MKKSYFINLVIGVIAGLMFSLGMCMCLLPEWDLFIPGVVLTSVGGVVLVSMGIFAYVKSAKNRTPIKWKLVGKISYGVVSALIVGIGMCMAIVWNMIVLGIIIGVVGIVMLLFLIPMLLGFKN